MLHQELSLKCYDLSPCFGYNIVMEWISAEETLPQTGRRVLVWSADLACHEIASLDEGGGWKGRSGESLDVSYWMYLPGPPPPLPGEAAIGITAEVIGNCVTLALDDNKETVAELMQHFLNSDQVTINGSPYFVEDMKNEIVGDNAVSTFYLRKAD